MRFLTVCLKYFGGEELDEISLLILFTFCLLLYLRIMLQGLVAVVESHLNPK